MQEYNSNLNISIHIFFFGTLIKYKFLLGARHSKKASDSWTNPIKYSWCEQGAIVYLAVRSQRMEHESTLSISKQ
jgi:hypothetical protein